MSLRKVNFVEGEYYHVYNRGVDKRAIFNSIVDVNRFFLSMTEFNREDPIGSLYEKSFQKIDNEKPNPLVSFVAYCLNPNHFHFIVTPVAEKGIELFMQRLGTGYTMYFNERYDRSGCLFQGKYKASHISSNEYLLHVSAYVNLNNEVHQLGGKASKLVKSSWNEYIVPNSKGICDKDIILGQYTVNGYKKFALDSLKDIIERKECEKNFRDILID
ncbi:MAG: transposase [Candidatus Taylorbacteria bacterium]